MDKQKLSIDPSAGLQRADLTIRIGDRANVTAGVAVTTTGLLAIGALVSSILLSTAVIVRVAVGRQPPQK